MTNPAPQLDTYALLDTDGVVVDAILVNPADPDSVAVLEQLVAATDGPYGRVRAYDHAGAYPVGQRPHIGSRATVSSGRRTYRRPASDDAPAPESAPPAAGPNKAGPPT